MPLTTGFNHVALLTADIDRFVQFYVDVFDAEVRHDLGEGGMRHVVLDLGAGSCLHPFQIEGNPHGQASSVMFDRGHVDHLALNVADDATFEKLRHRLVDAGASDGMITDFGVVRTVWFEDPDGMGSEIALWQDGEPIPFEQRGQYAYPASS